MTYSSSSWDTNWTNGMKHLLYVHIDGLTIAKYLRYLYSHYFMIVYMKQWTAMEYYYIFVVPPLFPNSTVSSETYE